MDSTARHRRRKAPGTKAKRTKLSHAGVSLVSIHSIRPSPENDRLYRPVDPDDPAIVALAASIRKLGVKEPLVVTIDRYILSGHRRHAAAKLAGLDQVPCRVEPIRRCSDPDAFLRLLREYNRQREKSFDERLREEVISLDPSDAHRALSEYRSTRAVVNLEALAISGTKSRCAISPAKQPFLNAILKVLEAHREYWPLSDRRIHYVLLNDPPLKHASKPDSRYQNDKNSYESLVELVTRARVAGLIPMNCIADATRPVTVWDVYRTAGDFLGRELAHFCRNYWRDLLQSQPNHIEIVAEKNTIEPIVRPVAMEFCIPLTSGRGYCSLPPRYDMARRYEKSGKEKLVLLIVSDFDPDGENIAHSFARSMRDDFGIDNIHPIKVALTADQIDQYDLPIGGKAKPRASTYKAFCARYGDDVVFELEALAPADLQTILRQAIESVIDIEAYNQEVERERQDAAQLEVVRRKMHSVLGSVNLDKGREL